MRFRCNTKRIKKQTLNLQIFPPEVAVTTEAGLVFGEHPFLSKKTDVYALRKMINETFFKSDIQEKESPEEFKTIQMIMNLKDNPITLGLMITIFKEEPSVRHSVIKFLQSPLAADPKRASTVVFSTQSTHQDLGKSDTTLSVKSTEEIRQEGTPEKHTPH